MSDPADKPLTFNTLGHYDYPATPADESIRRIGWQLWKYFEKDEEDPFISEDSLKWANKQRLDYIAAPPACRPVMDEMQATFADWINDTQPSRWLQLVVLPPGDTNDVVQSWASDHGHHVVTPPPRDEMLQGGLHVELPIDCDGPLIVIPRLEHWFLRHQDGMQQVRELLRQAAQAKRHCVIGCNSWAWQFLKKSIGAGRLLPLGLTLNAFDADRLRSWLMDLAKADGQSAHVFRFSESGSKLGSDYFAKLAARSLGIPWVAWQLWRRALRLGPSQERRDEQKFPDEQTLWLSELDDFRLPRHDVNVALLTLHALLIHENLTSEQLDLVTPSLDASNVLPSLVEAEFIESHEGRYRCVPAVYPAIRSRLIDAGFPKDTL